MEAIALLVLALMTGMVGYVLEKHMERWVAIFLTFSMFLVCSLPAFGEQVIGIISVAAFIGCLIGTKIRAELNAEINEEFL
ncbi:MAG TPA: hypothetical protein VEA59_07375 [Patescibacteria group bacterium]|nr:hypothetical protein [Patescibacteria group bacterium]